MGKKRKLNVNVLINSLSESRPCNREALRQWISVFLGIDMPEHAVCHGHGTPLDYLAHAFFEEKGDAVVWACRGGGKTMVGAVATLLDMLFKPGIQIRILGGSFEQSEKMYAYLLKLLNENFPGMKKGNATRHSLQLINGSRVDVLAQSDRSVRGQRVQKLRCDEVELFDPDIWQAAQLTTRSVTVNTTSRVHDALPTESLIRGSVEAFSTMHKPDGLMQRLLSEAASQTAPADGPEKMDGEHKVFSWCIWDVMEKCPPERSCGRCPLWEGCLGRAKLPRGGTVGGTMPMNPGTPGSAPDLQCPESGEDGDQPGGFVPIDDVIAMKSRVSAATWEHEMLCHPPRVEHGVFPAFRRGTHVRSAEGQVFAPGSKLVADGRTFVVEGIYAGVDFGYRGAFVCLWVVMMREGTRPDSPRVMWVVDEMVAREQTLARNVMGMRDRPWDVLRVYCDVAGRSTNSQTGRTDERVLCDEGFVTKARTMKIDEGIGMIADLANPATGLPRLMIDPRCPHLIVAMESYERGPDGQPIKDGRHDHLIDALRYAVVNHDGGWKTEWRLY